ncbi:MAG: tyrosine-type recombinase/integrase, partial [Anaerolineae bacterium]
DPASLTPGEARWAIHKAKARVAASTAARRHGTWRAFYNWMQEKGWVAASPFCFGFAEATPRPLRPPRYLSPGQAQALLDAAESEPAAAFLVRLALYTGAKPSEITRLKVKHLDEEENLVTVRGRRDRAVPVQPDLFTAYEAFVEDKLPARPGEGEPAVPFSRRWMELRLAGAARQVQEQVGFAPTFRTLRWTRAVWDLRNGVPEERVRVKLGYSALSWHMHARRALLPWIPAAGEGETPNAAPSPRDSTPSSRDSTLSSRDAAPVADQTPNVTPSAI